MTMGSVQIMEYKDHSKITSVCSEKLLEKRGHLTMAVPLIYGSTINTITIIKSFENTAVKADNFTMHLFDR